MSAIGNAIMTTALGAFTLVVGVAGGVFVFVQIERGWNWAWRYVPEDVRDNIHTLIAAIIFIPMLLFGAWALGDSVIDALTNGPTPEQAARDDGGGE